MSTFIACYGFPPGFTLDSRAYLQMVLNMDRILMRQAVAVLRGVAAAGPQPLDREWADAVAGDVSEVDEILDEANSARASARAATRKW